MPSLIFQQFSRILRPLISTTNHIFTNTGSDRIVAFAELSFNRMFAGRGLSLRDLDL